MLRYLARFHIGRQPLNFKTVPFASTAFSIRHATDKVRPQRVQNNGTRQGDASLSSETNGIVSEDAVRQMPHGNQSSSIGGQYYDTVDKGHIIAAN
jgi:hypothetical protein